MLPSRGFEKGLARQRRSGVTGVSGGGEGKVTCPIDHPEGATER